MRLSEFPVPSDNNGFGWHGPPALADVAPLDKTVALLQRMKGTGAQWVKLITSAGGDIGWERGNTNTGACEMTFCAALDLEFGVVVRIYNSWAPPYINPAIKANLTHLLHLAQGKPFYVECANEIDAEASHYIDDDMAEDIVTSICDFIDACWEIGQGQIIPVWPSFGYGKQTRNWFQIAHKLGRGECLNKCGVGVHNYASANRLFEPWDPDYIAGTPLSQEEFDAFPWRFGIGVVGENPRLLADINAKRKENAANINSSAFSSGWYTYKWCLQQLDALGHTDTPLLLTETGTRVGEMVDWEPRIDPLLHMQRTLGMIADIRSQPHIIMSGFWLFIGKMFAPTQPTWEDQCCISPTWNRKYNATMPEGEYQQIKTPGQLPIIDELEAHPVLGGKSVLSKLCPHLQYLDGASLNAMRTLGNLPVVKVMNADVEQIKAIRIVAPDAIIVCRVFQEAKRFDVTASIEYANKYEALLPYIDVAEFYNEPFGNKAPETSDEDYRLLLNIFDAAQEAFIARIRQLSPRVKAGCFVIGEGNFGGPGEPILSPDWFPLTFKHGPDEIVMLMHEYTYYQWDFEWGWRLCRHPLYMSWAKDHGYELIISEFGFTKAIEAGQPDNGWRAGMTEDVFIDSLVQYDVHGLRPYAYVLGAAYFTVGTNSGWSTHEGRDQWVKAVLKSRTLEATPISVDNPIRVKLSDGTIQTLETETYLKSVVPAESPASWNPEALKAQAVAARSYALWRLAHPRDATYDINSDQSDQVYNPKMQDPRSDQAVTDTNGVYIVTAPNVADEAQYCAKCGRPDCPYCSKLVPMPTPIYPTRLCQNGAQTMAVAGSSYKDILTHYYGNIKLSDDKEPIPMTNITLLPTDVLTKYALTITPLTGPRFKIIHVEHYGPDKNGAYPGMHNVFMTVLDKSGARIPNAKLKLTNFGNKVSYATQDKPATEPGTNVVLNPGDLYAIQVDGSASESIAGLKSMWPDEAENVRNGHHCFEVWWQQVDDTPGPTPDPDPTPVPGDEFTAQDQADVAHIEVELNALLARHAK